jgi:hypothetical protein
MPSGAGPVGRAGLDLVGRQPEASAYEAFLTGFERARLNAIAAAARAVNASTMIHRRPAARLPPRPGDGIEPPFFPGLGFCLTPDF